jgi:hypothetical protein
MGGFEGEKEGKYTIQKYPTGFQQGISSLRV